jgi:hypothetical protein
VTRTKAADSLKQEETTKKLEALNEQFRDLSYTEFETNTLWLDDFNKKCKKYEAKIEQLVQEIANLKKKLNT